MLVDEFNLLPGSYGTGLAIYLSVEKCSKVRRGGPR